MGTSSRYSSATLSYYVLQVLTTVVVFVSILLTRFCFHDKATEYTDRLELKSAKDRTFGVGILREADELMVLTSGTLMKVNVEADQIANFLPT